MIFFFTFVYLFVITVLQKTIGYQIQCLVFGISHFSSKFNVMLEFSYSRYKPGGLFSGGGLYMEGVFRFKSWFLNAPELIHGGAYYRNFTVCLSQLYYNIPSFLF